MSPTWLLAAVLLSAQGPIDADRPDSEVPSEPRKEGESPAVLESADGDGDVGQAPKPGEVDVESITTEIDEIDEELKDIKKRLEAEEKLKVSSRDLNKINNEFKAIKDLVPTVIKVVDDLEKVNCKSPKNVLPDGEIQTVFRAMRRAPREFSMGINLPWEFVDLDLLKDTKLSRDGGCEETISAIRNSRLSFEQDVERMETSLRERREDLNAQLAEIEALKVKQKRLLKHRNSLRKLLRKKDGQLTDVRRYLPHLIVILGLFSLLIMVIVRRFSVEVQKEWVASGQVIQFMTVTIIISAILALGLSGQLNSEILGTLLGAIGGYVLSQGIGRATSAKLNNLEERVEDALRNQRAQKGDP